ncbi:unnamed protein product [Trichobilharzia szidati]|nr:unnamed protein product [Trichobilharzia szidati]
MLQIENKTLRDIWKIIANESYSTNDTRLTTARKFYKSCVEHRNISLQQTRRQITRLIEKSFGGWDLLPSPSQNLSETSTLEQEIDDFSLNDIYFPILSITGSCPLFSIDINAESETIHISDGKFASYKDACKSEVAAAKISSKYYEYAYKLGVSPAEKSKLQAAFELHIRLCRLCMMTMKFRIECEFQLVVYTLDAEKATYIPSPSYSPTENRIYINGAIMNLPFYHDDQTISERYGGLGILVDENGDDRPHSISHHGFLALLKQTECLRKQYKNYNYTSEKSETIDGLAEILSDNGGLRIAYKGYIQNNNVYPNIIYTECQHLAHFSILPLSDGFLS